MLPNRPISLALILMLLQACASQPPSDVRQLSTLDRIAASGQINIGYRSAVPPMSFVDEAGTPVGYSIDLCRHIADAAKRKLGREDIAVNFVPVSAQSRFDAIQSGQIDLLCGATTKTLGRSEAVGFTQLTFASGGTLVTLGQSGIEQLGDLDGKRIAVAENTTTAVALREALSRVRMNAEIVTVGSAIEGMALLDAGTVDAFSADQVVLIGILISRPSDKTYALWDDLFSFEPFALAIQRGDADFRLVADRALSELYRSGRIREIYARWFNRYAERPPQAVAAVYTLGATPE